MPIIFLEVSYMLKSKYLVKIVLAFGIMAMGIIVGYYGYVFQEGTLFLVSYMLFGIGTSLAVWNESRRVDEGVTNDLGKK